MQNRYGTRLELILKYSVLTIWRTYFLKRQTQIKAITVAHANPWDMMLGPLHTRIKSRDHEIVRAQKKVSKGRPNTPSKSCSVVMDPQV